MLSPTFQFFEDVCNELSSRDVAILPDNDFLSDDRLRDLQDEYRELNPDAAVPRALVALRKHFRARGSKLPFDCDLSTRAFTVVDKPYIGFVATASSMRGIGKRSEAFEVATARRLTNRGLGSFHRVGWRRSTKQEQAPFNAYLRTLGFTNKVILGKEKDGGFDILWMLPLGAVPHRPIVSFQCKNGSYDLGEAHKSNGTTQMSLGCHKGLQTVAHTLCVVFNDYIEERMLSPKPFTFVPLGLSDLADPLAPLTTIVIL
jgi:hypothetical protein